jgi:hypothetical protein
MEDTPTYRRVPKYRPGICASHYEQVCSSTNDAGHDFPRKLCDTDPVTGYAVGGGASAV